MENKLFQKCQTSFSLSNIYNGGKRLHDVWRSSRPEVFYKNSVLKKLAKLTGKHLCQGLFFNKVAGLRPVTLLKKRFWHRCFPVNFAKFLRTPSPTEHLRWLLISIYEINKFQSNKSIFLFSLVASFVTVKSEIHLHVVFYYIDHLVFVCITIY